MLYDALRLLTGKKAPSNKTAAFTERMNMDSWVAGTSNQLFRRGPYLKKNFQKTKVVSGKTPFFVIGPFCNSNSICIYTGSWQGSFLWKYCAFNLSTLN